MLLGAALPSLVVLFVWWFSTGAVIYLDGLPRPTFKWSMSGATVLFGGALFGLGYTAHLTSVAGAYAAFGCGLAAWSWQEVSFYTGAVTGPRQHGCAEGCQGWRHFGHALMASLWHEIAIVVSAAAILSITWGAPNQIGTWTFLALWWMHESARINVFLGVRNLQLHFLPDHLAYLKCFFRKRPLNWLFPFSVTASTAVAALLFQHAAVVASPFERTGTMLVAALLALAILEHWFLVLPLPSAALWGWGLASRRQSPAFSTPAIVAVVAAPYHRLGKDTTRP